MMRCVSGRVVTVLLPVVVVVILAMMNHLAIVQVTAEESSEQIPPPLQQTDDAVTAETQQQCGLYLALSSTSTVEDTNWGLFVGEDITGLHTPIGNPEIAIVVSNLRIHNFGISNPKIDLMKLVDYFEAFFWVPATAGAKFFFNTTTTGSGSGSGSTSSNSGERAIAAISGPGVLASYSKHMTNTDWDHRKAYVRPVQNEVAQLSHPNRGAVSPYYHCQVRSIVNTIKTGTEVFMEYGDSWAEKNEEEELTKEDYVKMDETVKQMITFFNKYNNTSLDDDSRLEIYSFLMKDIMKAAVGAVKARRIASILPPNPNDLHLVPAAGGMLAYSDPASHRSLSFLQKYGLCTDHVYSGPSTIPNIGRGAFAKRPIVKGNMVVPIPLTHIPDQSIFNIYPLTTHPETGVVERKSEKVISQQLIVNYCFGHPKSTMLFYPSGSMTNLINHSTEPNAKLQWSKHPNHQKLWFDFDPQTTLMEEEYMYMGLILEVVALRDIEPDEEIFIDYGKEWQNAYTEHVKKWNKKINSGVIPKEWPIRAVDINAQYHHHTTMSTTSAIQPFPTLEEGVIFPDNVMLMAFLVILDTENVGTVEDPKLWNTDDPASVYTTESLFEITILDRKQQQQQDDDNDDSGSSTDNTNYIYTVQWKQTTGTTEDDEENANSGGGDVTKIVVVANVPHDALLFIDRPGTSDQQYLYEHSFRHYIGIPDDIFPSGPWRNVGR